MDVTIPLSALNRLLAGMLVVLVLAGLGAEIYRNQGRGEGRASRPDTENLVATGEVVRVVPDDGTVVVDARLGGGGMTTEMTFRVPAGAAITVDGAPASLASLVEGARVRIRYAARDGDLEARELVASGARPSSGSEAEASHGEEHDPGAEEGEGAGVEPRTPLVVKWFSLSEEKNLPTWWSTILLASCAATIATIAFVKARTGAPYRFHWALLSVIFLYMSIDEFIEIHEYLNTLGPLQETHGFLYFSWVIPAAIVVLLFAASYLKFLLHLPRRTWIKIAAAGAIYVGGALIVELFLGKWTDLHGEDNLGYALIDIVEEGMEMLGASLFLSTLVEYLGTLAQEYRVKIAG